MLIPTSKDKHNFHNKIIDILEKNGRTNTCLMEKKFERIYELFERINYQFGRWINKL